MGVLVHEVSEGNKDLSGIGIRLFVKFWLKICVFIRLC